MHFALCAIGPHLTARRRPADFLSATVVSLLAAALMKSAQVLIEDGPREDDQWGSIWKENAHPEEWENA